MREQSKGEGAATWADLQQYAPGLICLTGGDEGRSLQLLFVEGKSWSRNS